MASVIEIMQLCRLCLEKDEVNTPIFEGQSDRQIFLKISACLPVKVSKEDKLPKNICDGCSCKLEMLYQFWNTSANAEKKLIRWLDQIGTDKLSDKEEAAVALQSQHSISSDPVVLKQEVVDVADNQSTGDDLVPDDLNVSNDSQEYLLQQEQLPYQPVEFQFQQDGFDAETADDNLSQNVESEPLPKQRKRRAAAMKALPAMDSEDEDDPDLINTKIAKTEEQSEESGGEDMTEPTTFVGVPSADDDEQPGPSGVGKASGDAPFDDEKTSNNKMVFLNQCEVCLKIFSKKRYLWKHKRTHSNEKSVSCHLCSKMFKCKYYLPIHMKRVHESREQYHCDDCNKYFISEKSLMDHKDRHINKYQAYCWICQKGFCSTQEVKNHVSRVHDKVVYECEICGKPLLSKSSLKGHMDRHRGNYPDVKKFQCTLCDKAFHWRKSLAAHLRSHSGEKLVCHICGKAVGTKASLTEHILLHNNVRPHKCEYCDKRFTKMVNLTVHLRTHSGMKPHQCGTCGKSFSQRPSLVIHMRYHTGERPYKCDLCNDEFVSRNLLNLHRKSKHFVLP